MKNKRLFQSIVVISISFILMITSNIIINKTKDTVSKGNKKVILIDPGHGGMDGGAVSKNGTMEKDINLNIGLKLKEILKKEGFKVYMTREEDKGLYSESGTIRHKKNEDLTNRCKMKNDTNCDLFISIHLNMFSQSQYYGAQVWYSNYPQSKILAESIQKNLITYVDNTNTRKEKAAGNSYKVLRCYDKMPSVLVECGFLSNANEEEKLKDESYQYRLAKVIAKSIQDYFLRNEV